jgi:hypothetical protein
MRPISEPNVYRALDGQPENAFLVAQRDVDHVSPCVDLDSIA